MSDQDAADAATVVQRLAVLLEAGVSPVNAWVYAAEDGEPVAVAVAAEVRAGVGPGAALAAMPGSWREVAVAWRVAETVGAPLAPSLRRFADALRDAQQSRDDVAVALADPAATAKLVAWLPLVAIALGLALGFDVTATFTNPVGIACVVAGVALMVAARLWTRRLVGRAQPGEDIAGLQGDVVAIALTGGVSIERALTVVAECGGGAPEPETERVLALSRRAGAPAVDLLRASAADARRRVRTEGRLRASRLSARLLLPLGVCTLPSFLLLGVGPMLLSVLSGTMPVLVSP
ncbi:type II secretion system F family protein [Microbacterium sp.]|uniref:type II secretion system F family protein n=1 Tax=Microbacterium sp. TaxID=51671 RepID=UPI0025EFC01F|nr:type II secretion system F family protein [Microbacterium sp.]